MRVRRARRVFAHARARSSEAGSSVANLSICPMAVGTMKNDTTTTETAKIP